MPLIASDTPKTRIEPIPAGSYIARCYSCIEIGTENFTYMNEEKSVHKMRFTWELPTEMKVFKEELGEQPCVISQEFTLSLAEKSKLRPFLESWRGKKFTPNELMGFDIETIVGAPCMLNVIHSEGKNGNMYAEIASISPLPKGVKCPDQINPSFILNYFAFDKEKFGTLPEFIRQKMMATPEYQTLFDITPESVEKLMAEETPVDDEAPDMTDVPF